MLSQQFIGTKGAQSLPQMRITQSNVVEAVQKLYDLLGNGMLGTTGADTIAINGIELKGTPIKREFAQL